MEFRYSQTDEKSFLLTGSQESEWQEKEHLGYILNQTVSGATVSLASKGQLGCVCLLAYLFLIRASGFTDKQTKAQNKIYE